MGADEVGTHSGLKARFSELVEPMIGTHGGRVVKLMEYGLLVEFPSALNAVNWAIEVQRKVADSDTDAGDDQRINYRAGVNLGDVIVDRDDISSACWDGLRMQGKI